MKIIVVLLGLAVFCNPLYTQTLQLNDLVRLKSYNLVTIDSLLRKRNFVVRDYESFYDSIHQVEKRVFELRKDGLVGGYIEGMVDISFDHKKNKTLRIGCGGSKMFADITKELINTGSKDITKSVSKHLSEYTKSYMVYEYNNFILELVILGTPPETTMCGVNIEDISDFKSFKKQ